MQSTLLIAVEKVKEKIKEHNQYNDTSRRTYSEDIKNSVIALRGETKIHDTSITLTSRVPVAVLKCFPTYLKAFCDARESFDPKGLALSYEFNFGNGHVETNTTGTMTYIYSEAKIYDVSVKVTDTSGLSSIAVIKVEAVRPPNLKPIASIQCSPNNLLVFCNALASFDPEGSPLSFEFNFGNGHVEMSTTGITSYAYPTAGLYDVTVKVTDILGLSSIATMKVQAVTPPNKLPIAKFNCDSPQPLTLYCFDQGTYDLDGNIAIRKLFFDDNTFDFLDSPGVTRHQFAAGGEHLVTLTVIDNDGGEATLMKTFMVMQNNPPIANFDCYIGSAQRLNCWSQAFDPDQGDMLTLYEWSVQYQGTEELKTQGIQNYGFDKILNHAGDVEVTLKVSDSFGASRELKKLFTLRENLAPIANINCFILTGSTYQCNSNAYDPDGQIISQVFKVNGVLAGTTDVLNYDFTNGGDYLVSFEATDSFGKIGASSFTISVDKPVARFACVENGPLIVNCSPHPEMDMTGILLVKYKFDGFDEVKANTASHVFAHFGEHKVEVTVYATDGKIAVQQILLNFSRKYLSPIAAFNSQVDVGFSVKFNGSESLFQDREVAKYVWDFGDGQTLTSIGSEATHSFGNEGTYIVSLTVTDKLGFTNNISKSIYIFDSEVPDSGPLGLSTVKGIDSDNDNVRDDVQRWIAFEAKDNVRLKSVLKRLAQNYQLNILNHTNIEYSQNLIIQKMSIEACLDGIVPDDITYEHLTSMMNYIHFYSEQRIYIRSEILKNMAGLDFPPISMTDEGQLQQCELLGL